jgi:hypothetical protein
VVISPKHIKFLQLCDSNGENSLQPVDFGRLVKNCTNLKYGRLGYVHRSICKGRNLVMHDPENDTLAMYEVYRRFLEEAADW